MGDNFFPDGLSRVLSLLGRPRSHQGCQMPPNGSDCLEKSNELSTKGSKKDACVQVVGGIDAEDEPLMEQQVSVSTHIQGGYRRDFVRDA